MNICHTDKALSISEQLPIKIALGVEAGGWQVQGLPGLQSECQDQCGEFVETVSK